MEALALLMFLTKKINGLIKNRFCADGSKQRTYEGYKKEDDASSTPSNESTMMTSTIDAHKGRDIMTVNLPGAYLHIFTKKYIIMLLKGELAEMMVLAAPSLYRKYVTYDRKGVPMLYTRMNKALYGLLESALDFYKKLKKDLEAVGFKINPYDPCVANRIVRGKQQTVVWHHQHHSG